MEYTIICAKAKNPFASSNLHSSFDVELFYEKNQQPEPDSDSDDDEEEQEYYSKADDLLEFAVKLLEISECGT